jgi:hypothetical protein
MRREEVKKAMPASQKIITKLRERRQIEADLRKMLSAGSELEFRRQAQRIAALGSQVIPAIVGNLDRADARMLAAMGTVAAYLDHDEVTAALRQAILHPQRTDQGRIGAMTILERFLDEPLDDDLLASLADPEGIAISSLDEVLSQVERDPSVLIGYVEGLDREDPDVVLAVSRALRNMGDRQAVEPLRMMAQDVREEIAAEALQALGTIRLPEAARALQTLIPIVAPILRPLAERLLRKLQFTGVKIEPLPPPDPGWRALVSPVDARGQQSVWFIQEARQTADAQFLNVLLSDRAGAVEAMGRTRVPVLMLPPRRPVGHVHDFSLPDGSGAMLMLEASFDLGRRLVIEALVDNRETQIPIAGPLRLLGPWLWGVSGADSLPSRILPKLPAGDGPRTERLLEHPAFVTWTVRGEAILRAADEASRHPGWALEVWVRRLAGELFSDPRVASVLGRRLTAMSEWLLLAGDEDWARLALRAAKAIEAGSPQEQTFVLALIRRDLERVLYDLEQRTRDSLGT